MANCCCYSVPLQWASIGNCSVATDSIRPSRTSPCPGTLRRNCRNSRSFACNWWIDYCWPATELRWWELHDSRLDCSSWADGGGDGDDGHGGAEVARLLLELEEEIGVDLDLGDSEDEKKEDFYLWEHETNWNGDRRRHSDQSCILRGGILNGEMVGLEQRWVGLQWSILTIRQLP